MGFSNWFKKKSLLGKIMILIFGLIVLSLVIVISILFYPIGGKIVEDKPLLKNICEFNPICRVTTGGGINCKRLDAILESGRLPTGSDFLEYAKWEGYKGCNNNTKGFDGGEYIRGIEHCVCPPIMS